MPTHKDYIEELLLKDDLSKALEELRKGTKAGKQDDLYNNVIFQYGRNARNEEEKEEGTPSDSEYKRERAKIRRAVQTLLKEYRAVLPYPERLTELNKTEDLYGIEEEIQGIKEALDLLIEKKNFIEKSLITVYDVNQVFSLRKQLEDLEKEIDKYRSKIRDLINGRGNVTNTNTISGTGNFVFENLNNAPINLQIEQLQAQSDTLRAEVAKMRETPPTDDSIKILFMSAMPDDQFRFNSDFDAIKNKCKRSIEKNELRFLLPTWETDYETLLLELKELRPNVLHFSGHGTEDGLCLINKETRETQFLENYELRDIFEDRKSHLKLVLLNSCFSETQAKIISGFGIYVLGIKGEIEPKIATNLSESFYVGFTTQDPPISIEKAIRRGCTSFSKTFNENANQISLWKDGKEIDYKTI